MRTGRNRTSSSHRAGRSAEPAIPAPPACGGVADRAEGLRRPYDSKEQTGELGCGAALTPWRLLELPSDLVRRPTIPSVDISHPVRAGLRLPTRPPAGKRIGPGTRIAERRIVEADCRCKE